MAYLVKGLGLGSLVLFSSSVLAATPSSQLDWATTFGSLLFVIVFILFLAWLLKRMRIPALVNQQGLSVVRQIPVGTRERIMIVQAGEEQFLVGVTAQSIQLISKLDKPISQEELNKPAFAASPFASQLSQLLKKHDKN
ncbi:flagellar biosynthesis protein FliO [Vibrio variabilis]|uniref:Flagellar protein n=2 Tax=Vibrio TaxID=662 RepID=A0ABR4Y5Z4_9VIBR|nr:MULTISPECIES: flagellar biosynthetic protein FliO [Vibrio]KHA58781.1 flagellar biosynthesis protein FliO [Vibrio variabilis]KHT45965.1 flagellar biosynthesis protein FliO [Vibrio sinaloensis]KHT47158.1 flagellar biosynthesis protein FliO [Vibrio sinaloensis]